MKTYEYAGDLQALARSHPWTTSASDPTHRYYDLKRAPALVRTALEDFVPWGQNEAIERFYSLVEWVNGPQSLIESNDCAFTPPAPNQSPEAPAALECSGRLMVLFRERARNLADGDLAALTLSLHRALSGADTGFELGALGTTLTPVHYLPLAGSGGEGASGKQLMLSFWAWGNSEGACMANLGRLVDNLGVALRGLARG